VWKAFSSRIFAVVSILLLVVCGAIAGTRSSLPSAPSLDPTLFASLFRLSPTPQSGRAESPPAGRTLYADNFQSDPAGASPPAGWESLGSWKGVTGGGSRALSHDDGSRLGILLTGSPGWSNYQVAVDLELDRPHAGFAGLVGRYQTADDHYECVVHGNDSVQLWRLRNGQGRELGSTQLAIAAGRPHRLALSLEGDQLTCSLDLVVMASARDASLAAGRPGLIAGSGVAARFDNVAVTVRLPSGAPSGSSPAATPSRSAATVGMPPPGPPGPPARPLPPPKVHTSAPGPPAPSPRPPVVGPSQREPSDDHTETRRERDL
jgi:hypothetical protein